MGRLIVQAGLGAALALAGVQARAQSQVDSREGIALENEILELRQQLQQTQQQMAGLQQLQAQTGAPSVPAAVPEGEAPPPAVAPGAPSDVVAQLLVRVSALEEQVRTLKGSVDELSNTQQRDHDDLTKQIGDLAFKVNPAGANPQGGAPGGAPATGAAPETGADGTTSVPADMFPNAPPPPAPAPHRTPDQMLKLGQAALARRDYDAAATAAKEVLALGPGPRAGEAQYLLAHAEAGKHDYKTAAASYFAVYKASPRSVRGAESLIGVANAFLGMGDKPHACQTLLKFGAEFPHPDASLRGAAGSVRKRAGC
jgi:TolA-binding protein